MENKTVVSRQYKYYHNRKNKMMTCQICNCEFREVSYPMHIKCHKHIQNLNQENSVTETDIKKPNKYELITCELCNTQMQRRNLKMHERTNIHKNKIGLLSNIQNN